MMPVLFLTNYFKVVQTHLGRFIVDATWSLARKELNEKKIEQSAHNRCASQDNREISSICSGLFYLNNINLSERFLSLTNRNVFFTLLYWRMMSRYFVFGLTLNY